MGDIKRMIAQIQNGEAVFVRGYTNTRTVHQLECKGVTIPVLYSRTLKRIVTVLPEGELNGN